MGDDEREQHDEVADRLENEADDLEQASDELGSDIDGTRSGWESAKQDEMIPGAVPEDEDEGDDGDS